MTCYFKFLILFLYPGLIAIPSSGQSTFSQKYGSEADYKRLYFLNLQYTQSWVRSDTATYNRLLWAEDFVHQSGADGKLIPKKELMPLFGQPRFEKLDYFFPENVNIRFITNDAALVFARPSGRMVGLNPEFLSQYNDVYVRREGKWICVSANIATLTKPEDPPPSFSQLPAPTKFISFHPASQNDALRLKELNDKQVEAIARSNTDLLNGMLGDEYILLAANGLLFNKQEVLELLKKGGGLRAGDSFSVENLGIRLVTSDVAMVHAAIVSRKDGKTSAVQSNNIYAKRNGGWVCVSGNNTYIKN